MTSGQLAAHNGWTAASGLEEEDGGVGGDGEGDGEGEGEGKLLQT